MLKRFLQGPRVQALLASLIGGYLELALRTTRWTTIGAEHYAAQLNGEPAIVAFWHEFLPMMPALWTQTRKQIPGQTVHVLISRHRDGMLIADIIRRFHLDTVHGSSGRKGRANGGQRGGAAGVLQLLSIMQAGGIACITPDGPRGPRRVASPGVAHLAGLSGRAVLPCAARTSRRITLKSWDRMAMPLPFGRGVLVCGAPIFVPRNGWEASLPGIQNAMAAVSVEADRQCG